MGQPSKGKRLCAACGRSFIGGGKRAIVIGVGAKSIICARCTRLAVLVVPRQTLSLFWARFECELNGKRITWTTPAFSDLDTLKSEGSNFQIPGVVA